MASGTSGSDAIPLIAPLPEFTGSPAGTVADTLHSRLHRASKIINEIAALLAPQAIFPPQPEETPPAKIRQLPKLRVSPAIAWKKRVASSINDLTSTTGDIRDALTPFTTWRAILAQSAKFKGPHHERITAAAVQVWRETDGVGLRHVCDAIERYSGLPSDVTVLVLDCIDEETHHERIWNSLLKLLPEGEEPTQESIKAACEAFMAKYPEIDRGVVLEAVQRFGDLGKDDTGYDLYDDSGLCGLQ